MHEKYEMLAAVKRRVKQQYR